MEKPTLYQLLAERARRAPDSPSIAGAESSALSYERLFAQVHYVAACLHSMGIERADRVAVVLPNGPEMAVAFLSIACSAVMAPLNPSYTAPEFDFYLSDLDARALVVQSGEKSPAIEIARKLGIRVLEIIPCQERVAGLFEFSGACATDGMSPQPAAPEDFALILHTSGTTSRPKMVPLTHQNLCASAEQIGRALALTESDRCLNIMPLFHIHGLVGAVLSSIAAGGSIVATPGLNAPRFRDWLGEFEPTWFTAVPSMLQSVLNQRDSSNGPSDPGRLRFIRSCSSALSPQLMENLEKSFGVPVVEAYGMTEAAHQIACNPLPPRVRKPGSVGLPAGATVAIMESSGRKLLQVGEMGEIVLRGRNIISSYAKQNPGEGFTDGWFRTGDLGRIDLEGYLFIEGRIKEIINRGGEKIAPREVEEVLNQHPAVKQSVVFALPDSMLGQEVGAAVVSRSGEVTEKELRQFASTRLGHFKVPRSIFFLETLPLGPTGKVQRIGLAEKLGLTEKKPLGISGQTKDESPRNPEEEFLANIWREVLDLKTVGIHQRFLDVGGDSLLAARSVTRICQRLNIDISLLDFLDAPTIADQARLVAQKITQS